MRLDTPTASVLSVPTHLQRLAPPHLTVEEADRWIQAALPSERWQTLQYRWCGADDPVGDFDDGGTWAEPGDRITDWLRPFNGGVLVATVHGDHAAAVGIKRHDQHAHEIAVVTSPAHRERGLAKRLVAQATRAIHAHDATALYLHAPENEASRRVADNVGYRDVSWRMTTTGS
jgi:RimJ/RimL family protein N-acetyltransferase